MEFNFKHLYQIAEEEIETTLRALPDPLRESAENVLVAFERKPSNELQADGIQFDTLGLFSGAEFTDEGSMVLPPQIILFLENVLEFAGGDEMTFRDEIRKTFLHELGHFLGLSEEDLIRRGLE